MRILASAFDYRPRLGGVATCGYEMLRALSKLPGVEVRLISRQMPGDSEFDRHGHFETIRIPLPDQAIFAVPLIAREMTKQMRLWRPNAVIALLWLPSGLAALLNAPFRGIRRIPYFVFAHGVELLESSSTRKKRVRSWFAPAKRLVFRNAKRVFAVSHFTRDLLVSECQLRQEQIKVVFNGVDPDEFYPTPKPADLMDQYGLGDKFVFLTVSRLDDYKGLDRAIAAFRHIVKDHPEAVYLICGEGGDRTRLASLARHYRVESNVVFAGAVPFGRLRDYYNLADCFVLLSREDEAAPNVEGFGIVFLEAAACEKPSIAGRSGGIADAVADGESGWLVDPWDDQAIASTFRQVIQSPEVTRTRGKAARRRVLQRLTWKDMAQRVFEEVGSHVRN